MLRQLVVAFITLMVVVTLAAFWPRPFSEPADPFSIPGEVPALGIPAAILMGASRIPASLGLIVLVLLLLALAVLPLVERSQDREFSRRPLAMAIFGLFLLFLLASLFLGLNIGTAAAMGGN
jgi:quinol-cytochrome oxidoreductase complex cytochrome b subunit